MFFELLPRKVTQSITTSLLAITVMFGISVPAGVTLAANAITNGSFEVPAQIVTTVGLYNEALVPGWETTASDDLIEIWSNGFNGVVSADAAQHAELNATEVATLYQDVAGIPANAVVGYSFAHRGRAGIDTMALRISDLGTDNAGGGLGAAADTVLFNQQYSTGDTNWNQYSAPTIGGLTLGNAMRFEFISVSAAGGNQAVGNFLDNVSFGIGVVPEPATGLLVVVGAAVIGACRGRRSHRNSMCLCG